LEMARRELSYDYVFLLHDTCHVRPRFKRLVEEQPGAIPVDYMSAASHGQFNIGLYRLEFLVSHLDLWRSWDGMTKARAIDIELNRGGCGLKSLAGVTSNFFNSMPIKTGLQQPYGASDRWGAWLAGADIHKFYGAGIAGPRQA